MALRSFLCVILLLLAVVTARSKFLPDDQTPSFTPLAVPPQAAAAPIQTNSAVTTVEKGYVLGTNGMLYLTFPKNWQDKVQHVVQRDRIFDAVFFTPTNEAYFNFTVEVALVGETNNTNHVQLKSVLRRTGEGELTNATEIAVQLKDFRSDTATGSYFRLTDKKWGLITPPEGEAKYLTQGYASVGPLVLSFRLLSNRPTVQEPVALEVIKSARFSRTFPSAMPKK